MRVSKLKSQVSVLYVCACTQVGITLLGFLFFDGIMHPKVLWVTSLALNLVVILFSRPFQIMDALIDGHSAQQVIKLLAEKKRGQK